MRIVRRLDGPRRVGPIVVAAVILLGVAAAAATAAGNRQRAVPSNPNNISDLVAYVHGKAGRADPKLKPVEIGYVNNQGGSIFGYPESTSGTELAVKWVNDHASGINGHPLKLDECFVKNAEEEGLTCAQKFLNNPNIKAIMYGALFTGAKTINSTVAGKIPIIEPFAQNPSDVSAKNSFQLFVAAPFDFYGWGGAARTILHAKTAAVLYPEGTGLDVYAKAVAKAMKAVGVKATVVGFPSNATDLVGALTAAGAQSADMVAPMIGAANNCIAMAKGLTQLGVDSAKVVSLFPCALPAAKKGYAGGDYPKWWYGLAQSGDAFLPTPAGKAYRALLAEYGASKWSTDVLYPGMIGTIFTIAQFMNNIGYAKLTPQAIVVQAKKFRGPLFMGEPQVLCGNYPSAPGMCGGGDHFFRYLGKGKWSLYPAWIQVPIELQKELHAKVLHPQR